MTEPILVGKNSANEFHLLLSMANRHGVITGATGTGKTVTLQKLAEGFSQRGVPVFVSDIKGDLSGISQAGGTHPKILERLQMLGIENTVFEGSPVTFWDVFGKEGHPLRATISEMGPLLLSRILQLNETQEGVLALTFKVADEQGMLLLDLKDLQQMLIHVSEKASEYTVKYGNVSKASIGSIQRGLLQLEQQGGHDFFGEPAVRLEDFIQTIGGRGVINILAADELINSPKLYSTFLLWLLSELFEMLPEAGDLDKPKLVFIFDEAHLLFSDAPRALVEKIEQVVRLIRSKGVGVYFVTQSPADIPDKVLAQLGNRVQHALRAYTPKEQEAVKIAAKSFRENPSLDTVTTISELGVGEALISTLDGKGVPTMVDRAFIVPPGSQIGPITPEQRQQLITGSIVAGIYDTPLDRESAYEILSASAEARMAEEAQIKAAEEEEKLAVLQAKREEQEAKQAEREARAAQRAAGGTRRTDTLTESITKSVARSASSSIGRQIGNSIVRGVLGSIFGGKSKSSWF